MGYQVGNQCFASKELAENHYFSLVVPTILQDGSLAKPTYNGKNWQLNGTILKAELPECDPLQNFADGSEVGWLIFSVMAAMYSINVVKKLIK